MSDLIITEKEKITAIADAVREQTGSVAQMSIDDIPVAVSTIARGPESDWNANEGEPGHVRNRTHYELEERALILEHDSFMGGPAEGAAPEYANSNGILLDAAIIPGETYILTVDGVEYTDVARATADDGSGNPGVEVFAGSFDFSKFPACVSDYMELIYISFEFFQEAHSIKIEHVKKKTVSLPEKFIPDTIARTSDIPTHLSTLSDDSAHRTVTDAEKVAWNAKSNFSGSYNDLSHKPALGDLAAKNTVAKSDLDEAVQASLRKADMALQSYVETDPTVPSWAKAASKPAYTAGEVGADPVGTAASAVSGHNTASDAHSDIRNLITGLNSSIATLSDNNATLRSEFETHEANVLSIEEIDEICGGSFVAASEVTY